MRRRIILIAVCLFVTMSATARAPKGVQYQGTLTHPDGSPMDTTVAMLFELYPDSLGGLAVWSEAHPAVAVINSLFNIRLGWITEFPDSVLQLPQLWLSLTVGGNNAMQPRTKVVSTFFALRSGRVDSLTAENIRQILALFQLLPDADGDGHDKISMGGNDCDDLNPLNHPGVTEVCDGIDNDCDGVVDNGFLTIWLRDADGDGYGNDDSIVVSCSPVSGYVQTGGDCDDHNPAFNPGAEDICDLLDNNCNGITDDNGTVGNWYLDADHDGWGAGTAVFGCPPNGTDWVDQDGDCDATNPNVYPGAFEICNGIDDDCNGIIDDDAPGCLTYYADFDQDTYGNPDDFRCLCSPHAPYTAAISGDCDDFDASIHPGAVEICDNGIDDDCDAAIDGADSNCP